MPYGQYFSPSPWERQKRRERVMAIFEDFFAGFAVGQVTMFVIGPWSLLIGIITGVLWVLGGRGWLGTKGWRRIGVPAVISLPWALNGHFIGSLISFPLQFGAHTFGYGEIDSNDPNGSFLGRIFGRWTRAIWYLILAVSMIPLFL